MTPCIVFAAWLVLSVRAGYFAHGPLPTRVPHPSNTLLRLPLRVSTADMPHQRSACRAAPPLRPCAPTSFSRARSLTACCTRNPSPPPRATIVPAKLHALPQLKGLAHPRHTTPSSSMHLRGCAPTPTCRLRIRVGPTCQSHPTRCTVIPDLRELVTPALRSSVHSTSAPAAPLPAPSTPVRRPQCQDRDPGCARVHIRRYNTPIEHEKVGLHPSW